MPKSGYAHNKQQGTLDVCIQNVTLTLPILRHLIQIQEEQSQLVLFSCPRLSTTGIDFFPTRNNNKYSRWNSRLSQWTLGGLQQHFSNAFI